MKQTKFKLTQYVVYPGHGVGKIIKVETKELFGAVNKFYLVEIMRTQMKILVPCTGAEQIGLRPTMNKAQAKRVNAMLAKVSLGYRVPVDTTSWSRRYRETMEKVKSNDTEQLVEALVELISLAEIKEPSYGERNMLDTIRTLIETELEVA